MSQKGGVNKNLIAIPKAYEIFLNQPPFHQIK